MSSLDDAYIEAYKDGYAEGSVFGFNLGYKYAQEKAEKEHPANPARERFLETITQAEAPITETSDGCFNCKRRMRLERWDWTDIRHYGVPKKIEEGFACMAFTHEGLVVHAVGLDEANGGCEMWCAK